MAEQNISSSEKGLISGNALNAPARDLLQLAQHLQIVCIFLFHPTDLI